MKKTIVRLMLIAGTAQAASFQQGTSGLGLTLGSGTVTYNYRDNQNYWIVGVYGSHFFLDGLEVGVGYRGWFGATPVIHQVSLPATYYVPLKNRVRPYGGLFYRYTFINDPQEENYSSIGIRAGIAVNLTKNSYAGFGWVQEYYGNCDNRSECSSGYPEAQISFSF
jgi:hypothetical protein